MDPSPEALGGLLFAAAVGMLYLTRARAKKPDLPHDAAPIEHLLHDLEAGICPRCESIHPEASTHSGPHGFWTNFQCPECHYTMRAHVHRRPEDAD